MIPVKLSLHNFMCYRDDVSLSFEGIHTACISGSNGSGKSTLIDALTWALWGKARGRSDDELVTQGRSEMGVEFDFRVGEQLYRVIRKRSRPKKTGGAGQSLLDFSAATADGFRSIKGNTNTETDSKIENTLHMNYQTFINSAFLKQGHADEFTNKTAGERKEILQDILQLSLYDEFEERARGLFRERESRVEQLESAVKEIDDELKQKPSYEAMLIQAQNELVGVNDEVKRRESKLNHLHKEEQLLKVKQEQLGQLDEHISNARRDISQWEELVEKHSLHIKEYEGFISQRQKIEENYAGFVEARKLYEELNQKARLWNALNDKRHKLETAVERAQQELIGEHKQITARISELTARSEKLAQYRAELQQFEAKSHQLSEQEKTLRGKRQAVQEAQARISYLESGRNRFRQEMQDIAEKLKLLSSQQESKCPLCESDLGAEKLRLIESKYAVEQGQKAEAIKSAEAEIVQKKVDIRSLDSDILRLEKELELARSFIQKNIGGLNTAIAEAEKSAGQLAEEKEKLAEIENRLSRKNFAVSEQKALYEIDGEIGGLDYSAQKHDEVTQRYRNLQQYEEPKRRLDDAVRLIDGERESASKAVETVRQRQATLEAESQQRQTLVKELEALPQLTKELSQIETEYRQAVEQQKQSQETVGRAKEKLAHLAEVEVRRGEKEKELAQVSREAGVYTELVRAFGKGGIQALLIESALPEIEEEANRLLARMTDNRMHIKIETQRETKKGSLQETFDINIGDELGTRSYEMFSGGEAFRINFAIRIALSRLLARRAGAPLRTLIIDEGFGTQDSTGIEKMREAIQSIEEDFDKILVITHIEEFRDAFPTRIDVVKTADGSTIQVS